MSHPQPTMPPRQFSPQLSPNGNYQLPPNKRAKLSPGPGPSSNPGSPYPNYAASPTATTPAPTPPITLPSPAPINHTNNQASPGGYNTPYQQPNGRPASVGMSLTMPTAASTPPLASPQPPTPNASHAPYSTAKLAPVPTTTASFAPALTPAVTNMGPPAILPAGPGYNDAMKQGAKPTSTKAAVAYDMDDMLMGTGIDLEEEAEFLNNIDNRGFPNLPPGNRQSLYGAGPANQPAQHTNARTQEELAAEVADRAWNEAAMKLAKSRSHEISHYLLEPGVLHKRLQDAAQKFGLQLNLEMKEDGKKSIGKMSNPSHIEPPPQIIVQVQKGPDNAVVETSGSFIPSEAYLVDQIALLSISTKQRLGELLSDANKIATTRQKSAHGVVPQEWAEAALTLDRAGEVPRTGVESAVSPRTNPLKRSADELSNGLPTPVSETSPANYLVDAMLGAGKEARNIEEARLKKRQKRAEKANGDKAKEGGDATSRAGSVAPGTPGSIAPETPEVKAPTKKESKKAAKLAEASNTTVNQTLGLFAGGKKKKYSWMTGGGTASGASTPRPQAGGAPGTPGSAGGAGLKIPQGPLTKPSVTYMGQFREDSEKGKNIQLRDWIIVLEERGFDQKSLQQAFDILDRSAKNSVEARTSQ
ncbi:hypothetical protein F5Y04DRAFT_254900 [Hypomontagnella monticulosa]|nr:hypothetical protein F5Y04DRAFT_254900 [Hypomontagnella monticulosa]